MNQDQVMRWDLINHQIQKHKYNRYLEIGVDDGTCFSKVRCHYKVGVDPAASHPVRYPVTSDIFFRHNAEVFDIIFIDGAHYSDQVDKDIANAIGILAPGGSIILHDTNPKSEQAQQSIRVKDQTWNGDTWKSVVRFIAHHHERFSVITLDTDHGLTLIQRGVCVCRFTLPEKLTYDWLDGNRIEALNLLHMIEVQDLTKDEA